MITSLNKLSKILGLLPDDCKAKINYVILLICLSGLVELFTLFSFIPFMDVVSGNENEQMKSFVGKFLSFDTEYEYNKFVITVFIFMVIASGSIKALSFFSISRLTQSLGLEVNNKILKNILLQRLSYWLKSNSSEAISSAIVKGNFLVQKAFLPFFNLISGSVSALFIFLSLVYLNYMATLSLVLIIASLYILFATLSKVSNKKNGSVIDKNSTLSLSLMKDAISNIKDIVINHSEFFYIKKFQSNEASLKRAYSNMDIISAVPKFIIETLLLLVLSLSVLYYLSIDGNSNELISTIAVFALGVQRLTPNIQMIYGGYSLLSSSSETLNSVVKLLELSTGDSEAGAMPSQKTNISSVELSNVSYSYPNSNDVAIKNINLTISSGEHIGILGKSGSGKTTLINLILGLIKPDSGDFFLNEEPITSKSLYNLVDISYVSQTPYFFDDSIKNNIIQNFKYNKSEKTLAEVVKAACLEDLVLELPGGLDYIVGENGNRLSGGQLQRIAIARALYKNSQLLVLDEATSALDSSTQNQIYQNLKTIPDISIISISHRKELEVFFDSVLRL